MDTGRRNSIRGWVVDVVAGLNPMKSFTFILALGVAGIAAWAWFEHSGDPRPPFPHYGAIAASYAAGFIIGGVLWKIVKIAAVLAAIALGGLALLNHTGVDASKAKDAVTQSSKWVHQEAGSAKHYLLHLLPSGGAAGVGAFVGRRRRRNDDETTPERREG
jgi:uncharacterized membrane protein (Fun14 family)